MSSREDDVDVSERVIQLVSNIVAKTNVKKTCTVKYYSGSEAGDGYSTKTFAVDISDGETSINLFLKCALDLDKFSSITSVIYDNEIYFYKIVYTTYTEFWKNKGIEDGFRNAPMCYGFDETKGFQILALENLRKKRFTLFDKVTCMNDEHLKLTLTTFAKFHAISFAIKDQRKDLHKEFCERGPCLMGNEEMMANTVSKMVKAFIDKLDAIEDKDILDRCDNLHSRASDHIRNINNNLTDYSIFTKGDCWINNMMILYEDDDREHPRDVMLIDWQGICRATPIHDFGGLFYSVASEETVENYNYYLDMYHEELSRRIKELGSDPEVLYPRSVFQKEWINYGLFSLGLSLGLIKIMLSQKEDAPKIEKTSNMEDVEDMFANVKHDEEQYLIRAKYIVRHMIKIGVI